MSEVDEKVVDVVTPESPIEEAEATVEPGVEAAPAKIDTEEEVKADSGRKFCTNCGEPLKPGQKFCGNCGMKFDVREIKPEAVVSSNIKAPANLKKKPIVFIIAGVVVVIALIALLGGGSSKNLAKKYSSWASESWCTIGEDGSYIQLDTNPLDLDDHNEAEAFEAIKQVNKDLGFNESVMQQMLQTTALMGRQSAESKEATVTWSYHPNSGLIAFYELK